MNIAYCPYCNSEVSIKSFEAVSQNIFWHPCNNDRCRCRNISFKTDQNGFILEPHYYRGKYMLRRNDK